MRILYLQKHGGRQYNLDGSCITIQAKVVQKFTDWNAKAPGNTALDAKMVRALLIACVGINALKQNDVASNVTEFIQGIRHYRVFC